MKTIPWLPLSKKNIAGLALRLLAAAVVTGCYHHCEVTPESIATDPDGNQILEPDETVAVEPSWHYASVFGGTCPPSEPCPTSAPLDLSVSSFTGPAGGVYTVADGLASYAIPIGHTSSCAATGNCYAVSVSAPDGRPALHWHATLVEAGQAAEFAEATSWLLPTGASMLAPATLCPITTVAPKAWSLHIGASFSDVATSSPFYPFIEKLLHHEVTGGCGDGNYCPASSSRRDQMSVFLLKAKHGGGYLPPHCTGVFTDVPCPGLFADWVEEVSAEGIIEPCGNGTYCPDVVVTRRHMAAWLLKALLGTSYVPPAPTGYFGDVTILDDDAGWIEDLHRRGITAGCSITPPLYCPENVNTRAQMAVFLDKTFSLTF
jgi:hypothetical protein